MLRILGLTVLAVSSVAAHDGPHQASDAVVHVLSHANHLIVLLSGLAAVVIGAWAVRRRQAVAARNDR